VSGGTGIAGNLYVGGNFTVDGGDSDAFAAFSVASYFYGAVEMTQDTTITSTTAATSTTTGAFVVTGGGGAAVGGNIFIGGDAWISGVMTSATAGEITSSGENKEYYVLVGSIANPESNYSRGSLYLQGQNALENYGCWRFSVGTIEPGTSTYNTTRLCIVDSVQGEERLTIDTYGYVGIGTSTPESLLEVAGDANIKGSLYSAATYTTSDYRIKQNIKTLDNKITTANMRPVSYYNTITERDEIGIIAHELQEIYPFMVMGEKDKKKWQTVNYNHVIVALMNDVRMLREEIRELRGGGGAQKSTHRRRGVV
jgi:hypothetical protein